MDAAYDHVQEQSYPEGDEVKSQGQQQQQPSLNDEFKDAYKAFSKSPWGAKLGGLWGTVKKQSEQYYEEAQKEYAAASSSATKSFSDILSRTRTLSLTQQSPELAAVAGSPASRDRPSASATESERNASTTTTTTENDTTSTTEAPERPESLPADIVKEAESMLSRFKTEAAKRLKDIEKAEDAADEALLRFGTNIRNFLRDAVSIAPPSEDELASGTKDSKVLFESRDTAGKRVIHTSRLEASLHVIHSAGDSFLHDPVSSEWANWEKEFDVEKKTDEIAADLKRYEELRRQFERFVPEKVEYGVFWKRYYFLRHVVETEDARRKELLKGAAQVADADDVAWGSDDEEDDDDSKQAAKLPSTALPNSSTTTLMPSSRPTTAIAAEANAEASLKPAEPRKSNEHSSADSDASYDLVSGASSRAPGSPRVSSIASSAVKEKVDEESDEDWE